MTARECAIRLINALDAARRSGRVVHEHELTEAAFAEVIEAERAAWSALSDASLTSYKGAIPLAWTNSGAAVDDAIGLVQGVRDHIDDALAEVRRVLT